MAQKPEAERDDLILLLVAIALANDLQIADATWASLPEDDARTLKDALGEEVPPESVKLRIVTYGDGSVREPLVIASYGDAATDFSAHYIVKGSWLIASYVD